MFESIKDSIYGTKTDRVMADELSEILERDRKQGEVQGKRLREGEKNMAPELSESALGWIEDIELQFESEVSHTDLASIEIEAVWKSILEESETWVENDKIGKMARKYLDKIQRLNKGMSKILSSKGVSSEFGQRIWQEQIVRASADSISQLSEVGIDVAKSLAEIIRINLSKGEFRRQILSEQGFDDLFLEGKKTREYGNFISTVLSDLAGDLDDLAREIVEDNDLTLPQMSETVMYYAMNEARYNLGKDLQKDEKEMYPLARNPEDRVKLGIVISAENYLKGKIAEAISKKKDGSFIGETQDYIRD